MVIAKENSTGINILYSGRRYLIAEMALKFEISFSPFVQIEHKSL